MNEQYPATTWYNLESPLLGLSILPNIWKGDLLSAVSSIDGALLEVTTRFPLKKRHGTTRTIPLPSSLQGLQLLHSQPSLTSPAIIYQPQALGLWMKSEGVYTHNHCGARVLVGPTSNHTTTIIFLYIQLVLYLQSGFDLHVCTSY